MNNYMKVILSAVKSYIDKIEVVGKVKTINNKEPDENGNISIDIPQAKDGYTPQKGVDYFDGENGKDGEDGHTPVKGTDYWTESDKAEIKSYVDEAILGGEW